MQNIELINELEQLLGALNYKDSDAKEALKMKMELYSKNIFGKTNDYLNLIRRAHFHPMVVPSSEQSQIDSWNSGVNTYKNIIQTMKTEILLFQDNSNNISIVTNKDNMNTKTIFIVHVVGFLKKLDLNPIILHEQPDKGRNVLDKLIEESFNACFAIILLSPDDYGFSKSVDLNNKKLRARQNVVLELGYFIGKLKKDRVLALYKESDDFELPSDFIGTLYKKYDLSNGWKIEVAKELRAAGINLDMNKLL